MPSWARPARGSAWESPSQPSRLLDDVARRLPAGRRSLLAARLALERASAAQRRCSRQRSRPPPRASTSWRSYRVRSIQSTSKRCCCCPRREFTPSSARRRCLTSTMSCDGMARAARKADADRDRVPWPARTVFRKLKRLDEASAESQQRCSCHAAVWGSLAGLCARARCVVPVRSWHAAKPHRRCSWRVGATPLCNPWIFAATTCSPCDVWSSRRCSRPATLPRSKQRHSISTR